MQHLSKIYQKTICKMECYVLLPKQACGGPRISSKASKMLPRHPHYGLLASQDAPKTRPRRPKTPPKRSPMPSQEPFCFQEAPGCPLDAPGGPRESLQEAPGLDFGWIFNGFWEGKWKQVGNKMRSEPKTRTQLRKRNKSHAATAKARLT